MSANMAAEMGFVLKESIFMYSVLYTSIRCPCCWCSLFYQRGFMCSRPKLSKEVQCSLDRLTGDQSVEEQFMKCKLVTSCFSHNLAEIVCVLRMLRLFCVVLLVNNR